MHCENMPTKVDKNILVVKDDVYVREFRAPNEEDSRQSWWGSIWSWFRA